MDQPEYRTSGNSIHQRNLGDSFSQMSPLKRDWDWNRRDEKRLPPLWRPGKTFGGHFKKGSEFCPRYFYPFSIGKKKALSHLGKKGQNLGHRTRSSAAGGREYPSHGCPGSMGRHRKRRVSKVIRQPLLLREGPEH